MEGGRRAGAAGDGLMLSRTQPGPGDAPDTALADNQSPIVDAYLEALPTGCPLRILASRTVFAVDDRKDALRFAESGLERKRKRLATMGHPRTNGSIDDLIAAFDVYLRTPAEVVASLQADSTIARAADLAVQAHSIDPPHAFILRSINSRPAWSHPPWVGSATVRKRFGASHRSRGNDSLSPPHKSFPSRSVAWRETAFACYPGPYAGFTISRSCGLTVHRP
jgi:hypothetical protein